MGDLAEPKYVDDKSDNVPVMSKLYDTVGRAFQKSKEFEVSTIVLFFYDNTHMKWKVINKLI